ERVGRAERLAGAPERERLVDARLAPALLDVVRRVGRARRRHRPPGLRRGRRHAHGRPGGGVALARGPLDLLGPERPAGSEELVVVLVVGGVLVPRPDGRVVAAVPVALRALAFGPRVPGTPLVGRLGLGSLVLGFRAFRAGGLPGGIVLGRSGPGGRRVLVVAGRCGSGHLRAGRGTAGARCGLRPVPVRGLLGHAALLFRLPRLRAPGAAGRALLGQTAESLEAFPPPLGFLPSRAGRVQAAGWVTPATSPRRPRRTSWPEGPAWRARPASRAGRPAAGAARPAAGPARARPRGWRPAPAARPAGRPRRGSGRRRR